MSNLLDKSSILLTPTAYENGKILSVKPAPSLGSELVVNGDFATDSNWTKSANWTIANGKATSTGAGRMFQSIPFLETNIGTTVEVSFDITELTANSVVVNCYGGISGSFTTVGTHTFTITTTNNTNLYFNNAGAGNLIGSIDNVSVKQVIDGDFDFTRNSSATRVNSQGLIEDVQILSSNLVSNGDFSQEGSELITNGDFATDSNWNKGANWSIEDNKLVGSNADTSTYQGVGIQVNKSYKIQFTVIDYVSGSVRPLLNGLPNVDGTNVSSNGTYTQYLQSNSGSNGNFTIKGVFFNGSVTNVSVKEVGQDWTIGTGWSIGASEAVHTGSGSYIEQGSLTQGSSYKVVINVTQASGSGFPQIYMGGLTTAMTSVGTYTFNIVAVANDKIKIRGLNDCKISSVSVIEITDDTNLPRINYEGFSYQDALGSELITNGDFATDSDWNKDDSWSINNNTANYNYISGRNMNSSTASLVVGKTYKLVYTLLDYVSGSVENSSAETQIQRNSNGTYTEYFIARFTFLRFRGSSGGEFSIDNVSVKEYLGQEVVPDSGRGHWLFEPQSTNLVLNSNSGFGSTNMNLVYNNATSPDGTQNAYKSTTTAASGAHVRTLNVIFAATSAFSVFLKYGNNQWYQIISAGKTGNFVNVDIQNGVFGTNGADTENLSIKDFGNGWYRVSGTFINAAATSTLRIYTGSSSSSSWAAASAPIGSYNYGYGFQVEAQSFATSYIPTNGSTVTRLQDAAFGAGSSDLINSTEGVLYAEIAALANDLTNKQISLNNGTTDDRIQLYYSTSSNQISVFYKSQSGATAFILNYTLSDITQFNKVAFKWKQNDFALWSNGVEVATQTSGVTSSADTLTKLDFQQFNGSNDFFGKTKCVGVFKEALTDAELTCLTTI